MQGGQDNKKILESIRSKLQSPIIEIQNRAISILYTKISTKIISEHELKYCEQLPGILFKWINETAPPQKDLLHKVLFIINQYSLTPAGLKLLREYQALEFLEEFRKYLMKELNSVLYDDHIHLIKAVIKTLLPLQSQNSQGAESSQNYEQFPKDSNSKKQQMEGEFVNKNAKRESATRKIQDRPLRFVCSAEKLPKEVDHELYSLMMELKHGKKTNIMKVLFSVRQIVSEWGWKWFGYKAQLIQELVEVASSRLNNQISCAIINRLLYQVCQMHFQLTANDSTTALCLNGQAVAMQKLEVEIDTKIFLSNPFSCCILQTLCSFKYIGVYQPETIQFLMRCRCPYWPSFAEQVLDIVQSNTNFVSEYYSDPQSVYRKSLYEFVSVHCQFSPSSCRKILGLLETIFPNETLQNLLNAIPEIERVIQSQSSEIAYQYLADFKSLDRKLEPHIFSKHIDHLKQSTDGLCKDPALVEIYCNCLLTVAISVAREDALQFLYPEIKQLILKISLHHSQSCREALYDELLNCMVTEEKVVYLEQSFFKSEIIRMIFVDNEFYRTLLRNCLNSAVTTISFLELTKILKSTTKEGNVNFICEMCPVFHALSKPRVITAFKAISEQQQKQINSLSAMILSRIPKQFTVPNILLNLFSYDLKESEEVYTKILGLEDPQSGSKMIRSHLMLSLESKRAKKLKYSVTTIKNYLKILQNLNLEATVKSSALHELEQCVIRIDLQQSNEETTRQIFYVHAFSEKFLKVYLNSDQNSEELLFVGFLRVYCVLERRLRQQTAYLNQSQKSPLKPEVYLNLLIRLCQIFKFSKDEIVLQAIEQMFRVLYLHTFTTFTSQLLMTEGALQGGKVFPIFKAISSEQILEIQVLNLSLPKIQQNTDEKRSIQTEAKDHSLKGFSLSDQMNSFIKNSALQIQSIQPLIESLVSLQTSQKVDFSLIGSLIEAELSAAIRSKSITEITFLECLLCEIYRTGNETQLLKLTEELTPYFLDALNSSNPSQALQTVLINILKLMGLKKAHRKVETILSNTDQSMIHACLLSEGLQRLGVEELEKLIKLTINHNFLVTSGPLQLVDKTKYHRNLFKVVGYPANLSSFVGECSDYSQMLLLDHLIKSVEGNDSCSSDLRCYASILIYRVSEILYQKCNHEKLKESIESEVVGFGQQLPEKSCLKVIKSLSMNARLVNFMLGEMQFLCNPKLSNPKIITLQECSIFLETLASLVRLEDMQTHFFAADEIAEELKPEPQVSGALAKRYSSLLDSLSKVCIQLSFQNRQGTELFYSSTFSLTSLLLRSSQYREMADKIDFTDLGLNLIEHSTMLKQMDQNPQKADLDTNSLLLLISIMEYFGEQLLSFDQEKTKELAHFLQSSGKLLDCFWKILSFREVKMPLQSSDAFHRLIEAASRVILSLFLHDPHYFENRIEHYLTKRIQADPIVFVSTLAQYTAKCGPNSVDLLMRLIHIWGIGISDGSSEKIQARSIFVSTLNDCHKAGEGRQSSEEEDDSSLQERRAPSPKNVDTTKTMSNAHWTVEITKQCLYNKQIMSCLTLLQLSISSKAALISDPAFLKFLKQTSVRIDKKLNQLKHHNHLSGSQIKLKNSSISKNQFQDSQSLLSNSRNTVVSHFEATRVLTMEENQELHEEWFLEQIQLLISFFSFKHFQVSPAHSGSAGVFEGAVEKFNSSALEHREALRRVFYLIDKFYFLNTVVLSTVDKAPSGKRYSLLFQNLINCVCSSFLFSQQLSTFINEASPKFLLDTTKSIIEFASNTGSDKARHDHCFYEKIQYNLQLLRSLCKSESVRSYIYKFKLIEELNARLNRYDEKSDNKAVRSLNFFYDVVQFYLSISVFKDSHSKILNDKKILQTLVNQVYLQKTALLSESIVKLLSNLSAYKSNKVVFMQNRELHKVILGQLESEEIEYKCSLLTLLYNLIYRHAPALKMYKRQEVVELISGIRWDAYPGWEKTHHIHEAVVDVLSSGYSEA